MFISRQEVASLFKLMWQRGRWGFWQTTLTIYAPNTCMHIISLSFIIRYSYDIMVRVSLGYDQPPRKFNIENSSQISKSLSTSFGLVGGKPTAAFGLSAGKLTGTMMGLADEEVCRPEPRSTCNDRSVVLHYCPRLQSRGSCLLNTEMIIGRLMALVTVHSVQTLIDHLLGNIKLQNVLWFPTSM
jgi:hypothetical protein